MRRLVQRARDRALLELHEVLRECARLVREDVLDLAEVLVEVGRAPHHRGVALRPIELQVPPHPVRTRVRIIRGRVVLLVRGWRPRSSGAQLGLPPLDQLHRHVELCRRAARAREAQMYRAPAMASRVRAADLRTEMGTSELYRIRKVTHTSSVLSFLPWPSKPKYHAPLSSTDWKRLITAEAVHRAMRQMKTSTMHLLMKCTTFDCFERAGTEFLASFVSSPAYTTRPQQKGLLTAVTGPSAGA